MHAGNALLKHQIEAKLAARIPAALSPMPAQAVRLLSSGNASLDLLLHGGFPLGSITEVTGPSSSGRTSIAHALLANACREAACAYIDWSDTLSPFSAASAGVNLDNLLWVRLTAHSRGSGVTPRPPRVTPTMVPPSQDQSQHGSSAHPRMESKGMASALEQMLFLKEERRRRKIEGTPGVPNQTFGLGSASHDQVEWEWFNSRKVDEADPLRVTDREAAEAARQYAPQPIIRHIQQSEAHPFDRLSQAIRATDQILQAGGFRVVVLDLASVPAEQALRIPLATWFRFRRAAQQSDAVLLLLTVESCARSSAAYSLECSAGKLPSVCGVLAKAHHRIEVVRQRTAPTFGKKAPGRSTECSSSPSWMQAVGN